MFFWLQFIRVHGEAHRAAWLSPFKTRCGKDFIQPFAFCLLFNQPRTGYHNRFFDAICDSATFDNRRRRADIFNTRVGTRADKHPIDFDVSDRLTWGQTHILIGACPSFFLDIIFCRI